MKKSREISEFFSKLERKSMALIESGVNSIEVKAAIVFRPNSGKFETTYSLTEKGFEILREDSAINESRI